MATEISNGRPLLIDSDTKKVVGFADIPGPLNTEQFIPSYATDSSGNVTGLVGPSDGVIFAENPRPVVPQATPSFDIFDLYQTTDRRSVTLPNPYSAVGPDMVHPSCVLIPRGWRGWKYWMAYTPYPATNSAYENPCVAVSNDGENWETPLGLTNPIVQQPAGGYNADTHLVLAPDYSRLYLVFRERTAGAFNKVKVSESADGVTWSTPVPILAGVYGSQDYACPSVWYDTSANKWSMISHNLDGGATYPMQFNQTSGTSIYSGWGANQAITITNPTGGRTWWHSAFNRLPDGRVIGLVQDQANGGAGAAGALFSAESLDGGLTFAVRSVYSDLRFYRPNFSITESDSGILGLTAWLGLLSTTYFITREDWSVGSVAKQISDGVLSSSAFGTYPSNWLWWDNFNRADGVIGTPLVGSALTVDTGTFAVASNRAATGSVGNNRALLTLSLPDYCVEADFVANPSGAWILFRAADTTNYYRVGFTSTWPSGLTIQSIVAGGVGAINRLVTAPSKSSTITSSVRVRVVCRGRRFRIYVNGLFWEEIADTLYYMTGVKAGVQGTNASCTFDNLLVTA